ncbi:MAG: flagellar biosynthetic protein FliR [Bacilli bacterium]|nr:flagellar biosynthetic protein FliR [Bacilli bacterium]
MVLPFTIDQLTAFAFVLIRISSFLMVAPFFAVRGVPQTFKIGLAFFISLIVYVSTASYSLTGITQDLGQFVFFALKEAITGLLLGYIVSAIYLTVQAASQIIDMQIGFSMVNVIDPQNGFQTPVIGSVLNFLFLLLFIGMDGPSLLVTGLLQSYTFIPIGHFSMSGSVLEIVVKSVSVLFLLSVKLAMPVVAALFLTDVAFAILSRVVPQMNIYMVGMPLKFLVGFVTLILVIPALMLLFQSVFHYGFEAMDSLLKVIGGAT